MHKDAIVKAVKSLKFWIYLFFVSILRLFRIKFFKYNEDIKCIIISPGGVGTTFLIDYIANFKITNDRNDADFLKHLPYLPKRLQGIPILFVTGQPEEIYNSLRIRNYHAIQAAKLGCPLCLLTWGNWRRTLLINAINHQIKLFRSLNTKQILIVDYDEIWHKTPEIALHLGIDAGAFCRDFPSRKSRTSASLPG